MKKLIPLMHFSIGVGLLVGCVLGSNQIIESYTNQQLANLKARLYGYEAEINGTPIVPPTVRDIAVTTYQVKDAGFTGGIATGVVLTIVAIQGFKIFSQSVKEAISAQVKSEDSSLLTPGDQEELNFYRQLHKTSTKAKD